MKTDSIKEEYLKDYLEKYKKLNFKIRGSRSGLDLEKLEKDFDNILESFTDEDIDQWLKYDLQQTIDEGDNIDEDIYRMVKLHNRSIEIYGTEDLIQTEQELEVAINHFRFLRENNLV